MEVKSEKQEKELSKMISRMNALLCDQEKIIEEIFSSIGRLRGSPPSSESLNKTAPVLLGGAMGELNDLIEKADGISLNIDHINKLLCEII